MAFFISNFWLSRSSSDQLFDTLLHFSPAPTARAHRAAAAFRASSFRCFGVRDAMRALPPIGPPFLPSFDRWRRNASSSFIGTATVMAKAGTIGFELLKAVLMAELRGQMGLP